MRTTRCFPAILSICVALVGACSANAQPTAPVWSVGQEWRLLVKQYDRTSGAPFGNPRKSEEMLVPRVLYEFHVTARVMDVLKRDGRECVRMNFTAEADAPDIAAIEPDSLRTQNYTLTLNRRTWSAVALDRSESQVAAGGDVMEVAGSMALFSQALGFPVDWVIARSDLDDCTERTELLSFLDFRPRPDYPTPCSALRRTAFPEKNGAMRITVGEVALIPSKTTGGLPKEALREVEQVWHPGDLWWRSFRRFSNGRIDLEAVLVSDPGGSGKMIEVPPPHAGPTAPGGPTWAIGQEWRLLVQDYSNPATPTKAQFAFHMKARVTELVKEGGRECARIEFTAENDAPGMYTALFTLVADTQTWSPVRFEYSYSKKHAVGGTAAEAGGYQALLPTTMGIPLDWVALRSDLAKADARDEVFHFPGLKSVEMFGLKRAVSAPQADGTRRITVGLWVPRQNQGDMTYEPAKDAMCEVEQIWQPGELWWRSFKRWSHGHLELEATRVSEGVRP